MGGDIYQDIATQIDHQTYQHHQKAPSDQGSHYVDIAEGSMLQTIFHGQSRVLANSFHHQSVQLAPQLKVTATAGDGVIEAVESKDNDLILAVQWHPELLYKVNADEFAIIEAFVNRSKSIRIVKQLGVDSRLFFNFFLLDCVINRTTLVNGHYYRINYSNNSSHNDILILRKTEYYGKYHARFRVEKLR